MRKVFILESQNHYKMRKIIFSFFILSFIVLNAQNIQKAFLVSLFTNSGQSENVQHKRITENIFRGEVFSKVTIIGDYTKNTNILVKVNGSTGKLLETKALFNNYNKIIFAYELTFKHENMEKGYFEVFIDGKLYDTKVFVK